MTNEDIAADMRRAVERRWGSAEADALDSTIQSTASAVALVLAQSIDRLELEPITVILPEVE